MTTHLPLLQARADATRACTYCPKLCRPACPVSTVEGRETVTPWGKMRAMGELARGVAEPSLSRFAPAYACTSCERCLDHCELKTPVAPTLRDGRAEALSAGMAPDSIEQFVQRFAAREERLRARSAALLIDAVGGDEAFLPGCSAVARRGDEVRASVGALRKLGARCDAVTDQCCGLPLLEAGDRDGFALRARRMSERLKPFARVTVADAGCAHALRVLYPQHGVETGNVLHSSERLYNAIDRIPNASVRDDVVYHDACRLGRGMGVYDAPRAVLTRLLGRAPRELAESRAHAPCSGGGGLLPVSAPSTADAVTEEALTLLDHKEGALVVTACETSRARFERAGQRACELTAYVAKALSDSPS